MLHNVNDFKQLPEIVGVNVQHEIGHNSWLATMSHGGRGGQGRFPRRA